MLKKVISTSKKLADLKSDSARLLYTWLLPHLDIEGRFSADPMIVKGHAVPRLKMSPSKIKEYLEDMAKHGLIILYEVNGDKFLQYKKFKDFQTLRKDRESESLIPKPTKNSLITPGVIQEPSSTSKVNKSKVNLIKLNKYGQDELDRLVEKEFDSLWKSWPKEGRFKKDICHKKFKALIKAGKLERFKKTTQGYAEYLKYKKERENFEQRVMHLSTWLNNWEGEEETYSGFKYKPGL